jgi:ribonuclease HI
LYPVFIITFVWAVWSERLRFSSALARPLPLRKAVSRLVEYTISHMAPERRKRATPEEVIKLANNPPPDALVGFSDGSSIPNPGPCGAGALLILPGAAGQALSTMALGKGDNNLGEIAGLLQILVLLDEAYERGLVAGHPPLLLFTDSLLVVGALDWGWSARDMPPLIRDLRHAYRDRKKVTSVALYWVKGHSQITRNEIVDKTAKTGAGWSRDGIQQTSTDWTLGPDPT